MDSRTITLGGSEYELIGVSEPEVVFADIVIEANNFDGILRLSLGTMLFDGDKPGTVRAAVRLRMPIEAAEHLSKVLQTLIKGGSETKKGAN